MAINRFVPNWLNARLYRTDLIKWIFSLEVLHPMHMYDIHCTYTVNETVLFHFRTSTQTFSSLIADFQPASVVWKTCPPCSFTTFNHSYRHFLTTPLLSFRKQFHPAYLFHLLVYLFFIKCLLITVFSSIRNFRVVKL